MATRSTARADLRGKPDLVSFPPRNVRLVLAALALIFAGTHLLVMWLVYGASPHEALWACHIAPLLLALGCAIGSVATLSVATTWMVFGAPLWLINLLANEYWPEPTPALVHLGSLAIGVMAVRTLGWDRHAWWRASLALLGLAIITRLVPSAEQHNVNLVFRAWPGLEPFFPTFPAFLAFLVMSIPPTFYTIGRVLEHLPRASDRDPSDNV